MTGLKILTIGKMERKEIDGIISHKIRGRVRSAVVSEEKNLREDFGLDSLDVMEIIIECEGAMGKQVPNGRIHNIYTVGDIYKLIESVDERR